VSAWRSKSGGAKWAGKGLGTWVFKVAGACACIWKVAEALEIAGVSGFVPETEAKRTFVYMSTDMKAFEKGIWRTNPQAVHNIGSLHQNMNYLKSVQKVLIAGDLRNGPAVARLCDFTTLAALRKFCGGSDTHKLTEQQDVITSVMLTHLIKCAYDNNALGECSLKENDAARKLYAYFKEAGGGANYRNLVSTVFDISLLRKLVDHAANRKDHTMYFYSRIRLIDFAYALGMTDYAPGALFDTIRFLVLYTDDMRKFQETFFNYQHEKQHKYGSSHHGWDEGMEIDVKDFVSSLPSNTLKSCTIANHMSDTLTDIKLAFNRELGIKERELRHKATKKISRFFDTMLDYFDFYCPGQRLLDDSSPLTSYDGKEVHKSEEGADQILIAGRIMTLAALKCFRGEGESVASAGSLPPVSKSLLPPSPFITKPRKR
jgi:hypothetical protein